MAHELYFNKVVMKKEEERWERGQGKFLPILDLLKLKTIREASQAQICPPCLCGWGWKHGCWVVSPPPNAPVAPDTASPLGSRVGEWQREQGLYLPLPPVTQGHDSDFGSQQYEILLTEHDFFHAPTPHPGPHLD